MSARVLALPAVALLLVAGVLGVQVANGGGDFEPTRTANPCVARDVSSRADGIDGLTEKLVLLGLDGAACRLGISREAFTLEIASADEPTTDQVDALRAGLVGAVHRMAKDGSLPKASTLVDEALDGVDLPGFVKLAIRALPDGVINSALDTEDVLVRALGDLDLRELLANLDDQAALEDAIQVAVTEAAKESIADKLRDLV